MNKSIKTFTLIFFISTAVFAQKKEVRDVEEFSEISFATSGTVYLRQGSTQKLELRGDADDLEDIITVGDMYALAAGENTQIVFI